MENFQTLNKVMIDLSALFPDEYDIEFFGDNLIYVNTKNQCYIFVFNEEQKCEQIFSYRGKLMRGYVDGSSKLILKTQTYQIVDSSYNVNEFQCVNYSKIIF